MKYFATIALTIALIQLTYCQDDIVLSDYGDDAGLYSFDEARGAIDDSPKPIYDIKDGPTLFKNFIKKFEKAYKNDEDYNKHFKNFVENLKEINRINSDKEYSSTSDINLFSDLSADERRSLLGSF